MPKTFAELMEMYRNPGEQGIPDTFADELQETYTEELSVRDAAINARQAEIAERDAQIAERDKEVTRLKAVNYDLLVSAPKPGEPGKKTPAGDEEPRGVDSLFE